MTVTKREKIKWKQPLTGSHCSDSSGIGKIIMQWKGGDSKA